MDDPRFSSNDDPDSGEPGGGTVVAPKPAEAMEKERKPIPRYHVVLWNSDDHTFQFVERMLRELFGHTHEQCKKIAETVDREGRAIVLTTTLEHAELKRDQIHAFGKDDNIKDCKGSLKATVEEAP